MELGPQNHNGDGLLGPNSIIVVYMDPLGYISGTINVGCASLGFGVSGFQSGMWVRVRCCCCGICGLVVNIGFNLQELCVWGSWLGV